MPLTTRKLDHLIARNRDLFQGRAQPVILTLRTVTGGTEQLTVNAIWRIQLDADPTLNEATAGANRIGPNTADIYAMFDQRDITWQQLRAALYAQLPDTAEGTQLAHRYVLTDVEPIGMPPGGDRFFTQWTRQH